MATIRKRIESGFESWGKFVCRYKWIVLLVMLLPAGGLISQVPKITLDTSTEGFLHEKDPVLIRYNEFRDQFGRDEMVIIAINPPNVFDIQFLKKLKSFHEDLEDNVPHVNEINSMINARMTIGKEDELLVEDLLEEMPESEEEMAQLKEWVLNNPLYENLLISEDGKFTTIIIETNSYSSQGIEETEEDILAGFEDELDGFDDSSEETTVDEEPRQYLTDAENSEVIGAVREIISKYESDDFPIDFAGTPVTTDTIKRSMIADMTVFVRLTVLIIGLLLFVLFRRLSAVILPLIVVGLSLGSTVGLMSLLGVSLKLPTMILPSFILAVGIGDSVHILAVFFYRMRKGYSKEEAIVYALGHSGLAIALTSLTTAGGLLSFSAADVAPISDLGIFAAIGVMFALAYTVTLLPSMLSILPIRHKTKQNTAETTDKNNENIVDRVLVGFGDFATDHPWRIVIGTAILLIVAIIGIFQLRFSHNPLYWLPEDSEARIATIKLNEKLKGTVSVEVLVDTKTKNGWYEPEMLNKLEDVSQYAEEIEYRDVFIGKTVSLVDMIKEINKALHENQSEFYTIPQNRELVAQEFLLFENSGSDDLEDIVDSQFSLARLTIKVPWLDAVQYPPILDELEQNLQETFGEDVEFTITGIMAILTRTIHAVMITMAESYIIAFIVISILMVFLIGHFRVGMLSMIPNLSPIVLTLGVMGWFDLPLDAFTLLIGSIAIGLAVDDTIHFMHNFRRYYDQTGDPHQAVHKTLQTTGRAMLFTTLVLSCGFFIFMFASMNNLFNFGLLTGFTIIMALFADILLAPAIMQLVTKKREPNLNH